MAGKYVDFDKLLNKVEDKGPKFKIFGEDYSLPPSLPAIIVLKLMRAERKYGDDVPQSTQFDLAFSIFGEDNVNKWCEKGLDVDSLGDMIKWAFGQYSRGDSDADTEGEQKDIKAK